MVTVLVVDDEALIRAGLRLMIDGVQGIRVIGEAGDGAAALALATEHDPDVILMDVRMPGMDGIEAVRQWRAAEGRAAVVMLTAFDTDESLLAALRAGADSFLLKDAPPEDVVKAVLDAHRGAAQFSPVVLKRLVALAAAPQAGAPASATEPESSTHSPSAAEARHEPRDDAPDMHERPLAERDRGDAGRPGRVTRREWAVAQLVADGRTNAEIADELGMSLPTVKTHLGKLFDKFQITNRVQLAIAVIDRTW